MAETKPTKHPISITADMKSVLFPSPLPSIQVAGFTACETLLGPAVRPQLVSVLLFFPSPWAKNPRHISTLYRTD